MAGKFSTKTLCMLCAVVVLAAMPPAASAELEDSRLNLYAYFSWESVIGELPIKYTKVMPDEYLAQIPKLDGTTCLNIYFPAKYVETLNGIQAMTSLQSIYLINERFTDISPINGLPSLQELYIQNSHLQNLTNLSDTNNLEDIYINGCYIKNLDGFAAPDSLWRLSLQNNDIRDISQLLNAFNDVSQLSLIDLRGNPLSSETINTYIPRLQRQLRNTEILYDAAYMDGDANNDGIVDMNDFMMLKSSYATAFGSDEDLPPVAVWENGDFNGDGEVDIHDFLIMKANYNAQAVANVPEPASISLLLTGIFVTALRSKRGK